MKKIASIVVALLVVSLLAPGAWAWSARNVLIKDGTVMSGATLKTGEYSLKWRDAGSAVEVVVARGGKTYAKAEAAWETREAASPHDTVIYEKNGTGQKIKEIRFAGKKEVLVVKN